MPGNLDDKDLDKVTPTGNADCRENFMQTFVSKRLVGDIDPKTMYLNDRSCTGRDFNKTHYVIGTSYDACKTTTRVSILTIKYNAVSSYAVVCKTFKSNTTMSALANTESPRNIRRDKFSK